MNNTVPSPDGSYWSRSLYDILPTFTEEEATELTRGYAKACESRDIEKINRYLLCKMAKKSKGHFHPAFLERDIAELTETKTSLKSNLALELTLYILTHFNGEDSILLPPKFCLFYMWLYKESFWINGILYKVHVDCGHVFRDSIYTMYLWRYVDGDKCEYIHLEWSRLTRELVKIDSADVTKVRGVIAELDSSRLNSLFS